MRVEVRVGVGVRVGVMVIVAIEHLLERRVRWEARCKQRAQHEGLVKGGALLEHRLLVCERKERALPVIRAHPTSADAAKREIVIDQVHDGVVDAQPAGGRAALDFVDEGCVARVAVECERLAGSQLLGERHDLLNR